MKTTIEPFSIPNSSVTPLFDCWFQGHVPTLPASLVAAGQAYLAASATLPALRAEDVNLRDRRHESIAAAQTFDLAHEALTHARTAADKALQAVESAVAIEADSIIVEHLRPAHDEALAAVRDVLPELAGVDLSDTASVATAGADAAFLTVARVTERLAAIDKARERVFAIACRYSSWRDQFAGWRERGTFRDTKRWPDRIPSDAQRLAHVDTGPANRWVRTAWLADPANEAWLPTPSQWQTEFSLWYESDERNGRPTRKVATVGRGLVVHG